MTDLLPEYSEWLASLREGYRRFGPGPWTVEPCPACGEEMEERHPGAFGIHHKGDCPLKERADKIAAGEDDE